MKAKLIWIAALLLFSGCSGKPPANIGILEGENRLHPCPPSPNCVSSQDDDEGHAIKPFPYSGSTTEAKQKLVRIIAQQKRSRIITNKDTYIHAEFRSFLFRFVDDVEFLIDDKAKIIHCRSASRIGYSDLGVNRKRLERIRRAFIGAE